MSTVVRELYPEKRGWFGCKACPAVDDAQEAVYGVGKTGVVTQLAAVGDRNAAVKRGERLFAVCRRRVEFSTVVANVCHEDGYDWNYALEGGIVIFDHAKFLSAWALDEGACGPDGIDAARFSHCVLAALEPKVRDMIAECREGHGYRVSEIEEKDALPVKTWNMAFAAAGVPKLAGLRVEVTDKAFLSPSREVEARRIAAAEAQRELENQIRREYEAAVNGKAAEAELEEMDRRRKRAQLAFEKEQADFEAAIKKQRIDLAVYEANKLNEAKVKLQKALNDEEIRRRQATGQTESGHVKAMSSAMSELVERLGAMMEKLGALGVAAEEIGKKASETKADPVVTPSYHGMSDNFHSVMQELRGQAPDGIVVSLVAARSQDGYATRDLLPVRQKGGAKGGEGVLHVGDRMTLRLKSPRSGYLTLFNLGTSGRVSKIFPHAAFGTTSNRIDAGRVYMLPGELMPSDALPDGVWEETGPVSRLHGLPERIVAILTDDPADIGEQCFGGVARMLTRGGFESVEESIASILELPAGSWIWGGVEAVVED
jgi:hypothetical protein